MQEAPSAGTSVLAGFLTVVESEGTGFLGGYLILNAWGRPQEFHCTAAVKPNRAQEILYGPTLRPYLLGEQIAVALLGKTARPAAVFTDQPAVAAARAFVDVPVAVLAGERSAEAASNEGLPAGAGYSLWDCGAQRMYVAQREADRAALSEVLAALGPDFDLREPFERIRSALEEAQRTSRAA